jgi:outer membrane protein
MKRILTAGLLGLSLATTVAFAQTLDLEQAVSRALESDPRISEKRHLVDAARALLQGAAGGDDLRFDVNAFLGIAPGADGFYEDGADTCTALPCGPNSDLYDLENIGISAWSAIQFSIIKPLYTFGKVENYMAAAQGQVDVKRGDVRLQRAATRMEVSRAYYGYLAARDTRYMLEDVKSRVDKAEQLVQRWLDDGNNSATQSDLYAIQTGRAMINKSLARARAVESIALEGLKVLTGMGRHETLTVSDRRLTPVALPDGMLSDLQDQALEQRPEMEQLEAGLRARRSLVAAHKAEKKPNLYAGVVGSAAYAPGRDHLDNSHLVDPYNHYAATPVVGVQWEWLSGVQPAQVAQAQAELNALIDKAAFARQGIPFEVTEQYHLVQAYHEAVRELELGSRAGRRWMIASYADFEAGLTDSTKLVDAFQGYVLAHVDYLTTVNEYNMHVAQLKRVTGAYE